MHQRLGEVHSSLLEKNCDFNIYQGTSRDVSEDMNGLVALIGYHKGLCITDSVIVGT